MFKKVLPILIALGVSSAYAAEPEAPKEETSFQLSSAVTELNQQGYGTFSGMIRSLTMARDYESVDTDKDGNSSTIGLTLNYTSPDFNGLTFNAQMLTVATLWQHNPDRVINNNMHQMNALNINYNFKSLGLGKTDLTAGRIIADTILMPTSNCRTKDQAFEGLQLTVGDIDDTVIKLGWIRKFSSWSTRHKNEASDYGFNYEFTDIADMAGADYSTSGTYFVDTTYTGIDGLSITVGDYWSENLYNTVYVDSDLDLNKTYTLKGTAIYQHSVGKGDNHYGLNNTNSGLQATYLETSLNIQVNKDLSFRPGFYTVLGENDGDTNKNFQDTFNSATAYGAPFMANPGIVAGAQAVFLETVAIINDKSKIWGLYTYVNTSGCTDGEDNYNSQEFNVGHSYAISKNLRIATKAGYAIMQGKNGNGDCNNADVRFFIDYTF